MTSIAISRSGEVYAGLLEVRPSFFAYASLMHWDGHRWSESGQTLLAGEVGIRSPRYGTSAITVDSSDVAHWAVLTQAGVSLFRADSAERTLLGEGSLIIDRFNLSLDRHGVPLLAGATWFVNGGSGHYGDFYVTAAHWSGNAWLDRGRLSIKEFSETWGDTLWEINGDALSTDGRKPMVAFVESPVLITSRQPRLRTLWLDASIAPAADDLVLPPGSSMRLLGASVDAASRPVVAYFEGRQESPATSQIHFKRWNQTEWAELGRLNIQGRDIEAHLLCLDSAGLPVTALYEKSVAAKTFTIQLVRLRAGD